MGLIYGEYAGRSDEFQPGGVSYECGFVPHGVAYEEVRNLSRTFLEWVWANTEQFKAASAQPPPEMQISKGAVAFMMESSRMFTITDWAWNSKKKHEHDPKMWYVWVRGGESMQKLIQTRDDLVDNFSNHQDEVEKILAERVKKMGLNGGR
jgi:homogentisate 1,2-dioxygenase